MTSKECIGKNNLSELEIAIKYLFSNRLCGEPSDATNIRNNKEL